MISAPDRAKAVELIEEAVRAGARRGRACTELGLSLRTYQRWTRGGALREDARPSAKRPVPANRLSDAERAAVLEECNRPEHASLGPAQIVPRLADQGRYLASESTMYRILHEADAQHHRGRAKAPRRLGAPQRHLATGPCQVWSWDITWLPGAVRGLFYYLYLILDVYSRKIVAWEVHERESAEQASALVLRAVLAERCIDQPMVLHADNGSAQKGSTLRATLESLGIIASYSRPRVSDDNAFVESVFRTVKFRPGYPNGGFESLEAAREWVLALVRWYNHEHRHSAIRYVTPAERHEGRDQAILAARAAVYEAARARHPQRWTGPVRDWTPVGEVWLNRPKATGEDPENLQEAA